MVKILTNWIIKLYWRLLTPAEGIRQAMEHASSGDLEKFLRSYPDMELHLLLLGLIRPKRYSPLSEFEETEAFAEVATDKLTQILENRQYDYMVNHIKEGTPENRLILKGRYLELGELITKIKNANRELVEQDIEQAHREAAKEL